MAKAKAQEMTNEPPISALAVNFDLFTLVKQIESQSPAICHWFEQ